MKKNTQNWCNVEDKNNFSYDYIRKVKWVKKIHNIYSIVVDKVFISVNSLVRSIYEYSMTAARDCNYNSYIVMSSDWLFQCYSLLTIRKWEFQ